MKRILSTLIMISIMAIASTSHAVTEIKLAILAPEGSTWHKVITACDKELKKKTAGRVKVKIYAGGVLGDEKDVIRKMRIGQIHAAGLTGLGLGMVNPAVRVLELPMLVSNYKEADAVARRVWPKLDAGFEKKGFKVLGAAETGFINIFSNKPIASQEDMKGVKMWAWEGDPLVEEMYKVFKIVPIPLPVTDVMTSLQTHLIDGVYAPPLGAIALQWFTYTKYITDLKLADSTGGIIITRKAYNKIPAADRSVLDRTAKKYSKMLVDRIRADNEKSYMTLAEAGLEQVKVTDEEVERIRKTSKEVWHKLVGKLYSKELLDEAIAAVDAQRFGKLK
jgi:TRAP-type C4-dicarboxylate transport system substrate-binding protein